METKLDDLILEALSCELNQSLEDAVRTLLQEKDFELPIRANGSTYVVR